MISIKLAAALTILSTGTMAGWFRNKPMSLFEAARENVRVIRNAIDECDDVIAEKNEEALYYLQLITQETYSAFSSSRLIEALQVRLDQTRAATLPIIQKAVDQKTYLEGQLERARLHLREVISENER